MRILIAVHGYPPELIGGTELCTRDLARALARAGHDVLVCAGSLLGSGREGLGIARELDVDPVSGAAVDVRRFARSDLYFDHWQKWSSAEVGAAFDGLLHSWRPDVVHVQHWLRLTGDLVLRAARAGVPSIVSLHDFHTSCLLGFRVEPRSQVGSPIACERPYEAAACVPCAGRLAPRTPWRTDEVLAAVFADRERTFARELRLARVRTAPSAGHARRVQPGHDVRVVPPLRATRLQPRAPLADPGPDTRLVLGAWGHLVPWKGQDLILAALKAEGLRGRCELHLAGGEDPDFGARLRASARDLPVHFHGPFGPETLAAHPVTQVHAMVAAGRAVESFGLVLDEARELGLPAVLPRAGAFAERVSAREGVAASEGVVFFEPGDARDLAGAIRSLLEPGRLTALRAALVPSSPRTPPLAALQAHVAIYCAALEAGPPSADEITRFVRDDEPSDSERAREARTWDAALAATSAAALGFAGEDADSFA